MVKKAGISLDNVKATNKSAVLKVLNSKGAMSRKDIAKEVGLTAAAVTMLTTDMIEEGILKEKGELQEERRAGRRKILVDVEYEYKYVIAVSIEVKKTYISICDLKGQLLAGKIINTNDTLTPEEFLGEIERECKAVLWEREISHSKILGMGICIAGIVDRKRGKSIHAYGIWNCEVPIKDIMERGMQCPVIVENNVKAFAEGELLYGIGKTGDNLLFIKWGPGVGSAIVISNQIYEGKEHKAAEIGHYIIEPDGKLCRCGRRGCLETKVSTRAILDAIREIYSKENTPILYEKTNGNKDVITEESFTNWIIEGKDILSNCDEKIAAILNTCIERLARAIVNVITILAPDHTILFGFMLENQQIRDGFVRYCEKYSNITDDTAITKSKLSNQIYYIGATAIVTREMFFEL